MEFNSPTYFIFLLLFFVVYWSLQKQHKLQNWLLLVGSYVFYGWWDYRFLFLIFVSSLTDYVVGIQIEKANKQSIKRSYLIISLIVNLGLLFFFKYYNFFIRSFVGAFDRLGINLDIDTLQIILPVGISFYTFQTLSYTIDIYRGRLKPTSNFVNFFAYVSFFPQLVAGPIERATRLLPQFGLERKFDYSLAVDGMRMILYGLFKKMVIADSFGVRADMIFANYPVYSSVELLLGSFFFAIQLYADFSGYSDIAIGTAKLFGFKLMTNFRAPLVSLSIPDFWSRWHISLTTWFRDYLFFPLVMPFKSSLLWRIFSMIVLFTTIGLWHGANLTFVVYGFINGIYFIPQILSKKYKGIKRIIEFLKSTSFWRFNSRVLLFILISITTVFFRSHNVEAAGSFIVGIFKFTWNMPTYFFLQMIPLGIGLAAWEYFLRNKEHQFEISHLPKSIRYILYWVISFWILLYGNFGEQPFYYFQF